MNAKHLPKNDEFPAPTIEPSDGTTVKRSDVNGGQGKIVIPGSPGLAVGQTIHWRVRGNGITFSSIKITELKPEYREPIQFGIVFDGVTRVSAEYDVRDENGEVAGFSQPRPYEVI